MTSKTSAEQMMPRGGDANTVRKVVSVKVPAAVAWQVFTEKMGTWWPLSTHKIGEAKAIDAVIEPVVGGRWYERGEDGSSCDWGRVLAWEPPRRLVLSWEITADWKHDPSLSTEVEVRFIAEGEDGTRVELEHRHLDRYAERRDQMQAIFDSEGGWSGLLESFAKLAASEAR
jgi:uncharacterized protein YndB with AHSA1/START domain